MLHDLCSNFWPASSDTNNYISVINTSVWSSLKSDLQLCDVSRVIMDVDALDSCAEILHSFGRHGATAFLISHDYIALSQCTGFRASSLNN